MNRVNLKMFDFGNIFLKIDIQRIQELHKTNLALAFKV